jgi:flagellar hook-basal body complex protein FliE
MQVNGAMPGADLAAIAPKRVIAPSVDEVGDADATQSAASAAPSSDFASLLGRMVREVSAKQNQASDALTAIQSGQPVPLHQAVISMEEANLSFQLMLEVRNKLLDSYQEIMRMSV